MDSSEYQARRARLGELLAERKLEALLVSAPANVRYLSGFTGSNGWLLVSPHRAILLTDPRYEIQARAQTDCAVRICKGQLVEAAGREIRRNRLKNLGFESSLPYSVYGRLSERLPAGVQLVATAELVEQLRAIKSAAEIELIRSAVRLGEQAFSRVLRRIRPGLRELELAAEIDHEMRRLGADRPAFDTIVASGVRSALPHAEPTEKPLQANELVLIDMGARRRGYVSDMTRMAHLGIPARSLRELHAAVVEAQAAAVDAIREGVSASAVDARSRRVLRQHGLARRFAHSTGHGLGLEVHETPRLGKGEQTRLQAGMVVTIEPGVYMEGFGGIRIEDAVVVTRNGGEVLTAVPKELLVI